MYKTCLYLFTLCLCLSSKGQTVGLLQHSDSSLDNGYVLFSPTPSTSTYLIDKCGRLVKTWNSTYNPGMAVYLLPDGDLLRTGSTNNKIFTAGGNGGIIEKIDWANNVIWSYKISDSFKCQHHDVRVLPNGNVLAIVWESKTDIDAIASGRDPSMTAATVWSEQILEIKPIGKDSGAVVWEWHLWDHLIQDFDPTKPNFGAIASNPQLIDLNFNASAANNDWIHLNSIDYNSDLDQILLSSHNSDEIWIIDHSTSKAQAASHSGGNAGMGGDILYRWGNPKAYKNGDDRDQIFFGQHNARWIENGYPFEKEIMVFNNGSGRPGSAKYSSVEIIHPPLTGFKYSSTLPYLPIAPIWIYNKDGYDSYYAQNISGAQMLSNGNVLMCNGPAGNFTELTLSKTKVWEYLNPVSGKGILSQYDVPSKNAVFRCSFYPETYAGFAGRTLSAGSIIEDINPISATCTLNVVETNVAEQMLENGLQIFPNPAKTELNIRLDHLQAKNVSVAVFNSLGQRVFTEQIALPKNEFQIPINNLGSGHYFLNVNAENFNYSGTFIIAE